MFNFRSRETKANDTLLQLAKQGDSFTHSLSAHIARNKGHINLNVQDANGNTALLLAAAAGAPGNAGVLQDAGVNVNIANNAGDTPLMIALGLGLEGTARDLVLAHAEVAVKNKQGQSAADIAAVSKDKDIVALLPYLKGEQPIEGLKAAIAKEQADRAVIAAAKAGDVAAIEKAVAAGGSPNATDRDGHSALMWAATENRRAGIKALVALGADVNYQNIPGRDYSALIVAAKRGNDAAVEALLEAGAKTDLRTEKGKTAFEMAIRSSYPKTALLLAEHGIKNAKTHAETTTASRQKATAELVKGIGENNPFLAQAAITHGAVLDVEIAEGFSLVTRAAKNGNNFILTMLLTAGASPDAPDAKGRVPIVEAAGNGNGLAVRGLIDAKADVNQKDAKGDTALGLTLMSGNPETLEKLIDAKADANARGAKGTTFLETIARWEDHGHVIKRLGIAKTNLSLPDAEGRTPLMIAIQAKWKDNTLAFIEAGADVSAKNNKGESVLDLVKKNGWEDVAAKIASLQKAAEVVQEARTITAPVAQPAATLAQVPPKQAPKP